MKEKIKIIIYILSIFLLLSSYFFFKRMHEDYLAITNFKECVSSGYPMIATYPEQCKMPGKTFTNETQTASYKTEESTSTIEDKNMNPKTTSYTIEGEMLSFKGQGVSSSTNYLHYFGNELRVDFDGDKTEDAAFIVTTSNQGSGTFYYLVVALNKHNGYVGTNGVFLGDRIAPQTTEFKNNQIVVNYADRRIDEPMTTKPHIGVSRYFKVTNDTLTEVTQ